MEQPLDEVEDFLERQGHIVKALAEANHAENVLTKARAAHTFGPSSLLMKALDAKLLRNTANKLVAEYEEAQSLVGTRPKFVTDDEVISEFRDLDTDDDILNACTIERPTII